MEFSDKCSKNPSQNQTEIYLQKLGRPFAVNGDLKVKPSNSIISMKELGFFLTASVVRKVGY
jgi:hypothetical protein